MGYYTRFELDNDIDLIEEFKESCEEAGYALEECSKWYNWEEDLKTFSLKHPDVLFEMAGEGEGSGDIWKAYCKNGKIQIETAVVTFGEFDELKLV